MSDFKIWKDFFPCLSWMSFLSLNSASLFLAFLVQERIRNVYMHSGKQRSLKEHLYSFTARELINFLTVCVIPLLFDSTFVPWTSNGAQSLSEFVPGCFLRQSQGVFSSLWIAIPLWYLTCFLIAEVSHCCDLLLFHLSQFGALFDNFSVFFDPETGTERSNNTYRYSINTHRISQDLYFYVFSTAVFIFRIALCIPSVEVFKCSSSFSCHQPHI